MYEQKMLESMIMRECNKHRLVFMFILQNNYVYVVKQSVTCKEMYTRIHTRTTLTHRFTLLTSDYYYFFENITDGFISFCSWMVHFSRVEKHSLLKGKS